MRFILLSVCTLLYSFSYAQTLTGSWYGKADVNLEGISTNSNSSNNYLTELIIKQKGDDIEGIFGYYFKNGYKSQFIRAHYDKKSRQFVLKQIPLTYFRSVNIDGVDCMMDFYGTVMMSKVQTTIKGTLLTDATHKYTCPELRVSYTLDNNETSQDSLIKNSIASKYWQPRQDDVVVNDNPAATTPVITTENPVTTTNPVNNTKVTPPPVTATEIKMDTVAIRQVQLKSLITSFEKRENILSKVVEVGSDSVRISFYDNGDIDGDSISVFLNKIPVVTNLALTAQALNIYLRLDPSREMNELTMFAQNLGKYPPNTALMVINDGENRYEVHLSSSLTQNASVRLKRKK